MTDGQQSTGEGIPDVDLFEASQRLIKKGVEVFVLGIGENVDIPEMLQIAADKDANVFLAKDFDDLTEKVEELIESFCKGTKKLAVKMVQPCSNVFLGGLYTMITILR